MKVSDPKTINRKNDNFACTHVQLLEIFILDLVTRNQPEVDRGLMVKSEIDRKLRFRNFESDQSNTDTFVKLLRSSTSGSSSEAGFQNDAQILLIEPQSL